MLKNKPFRRAYVLSSGYNYAALADYCHDIVVLCNNRDADIQYFTNEAKRKLKGFDPRLDVLVPVHNVSWCLMVGMLVQNILDEHPAETNEPFVNLATYYRGENRFGRETGYQFWRVSETGVIVRLKEEDLSRDYKATYEAEPQ